MLTFSNALQMPNVVKVVPAYSAKRQDHSLDATTEKNCQILQIDFCEVFSCGFFRSVLLQYCPSPEVAPSLSCWTVCSVHTVHKSSFPQTTLIQFPQPSRDSITSKITQANHIRVGVGEEISQVKGGDGQFIGHGHMFFFEFFFGIWFFFPNPNPNPNPSQPPELFSDSHTAEEIHMSPGGGVASSLTVCPEVLHWTEQPALFSAPHEKSICGYDLMCLCFSSR